RQESVFGQPRWRLWLRPRAVFDLVGLRNTKLPRYARRSRRSWASATFGRVGLHGGAAELGRRPDRVRHLLAFVGWRLWQECAVSIARLVARRDGRPDSRECFDPRRNHGYGGRLYGRAVHPSLCGFAAGTSRGCRNWRVYRTVGGLDRADAD